MPYTKAAQRMLKAQRDAERFARQNVKLEVIDGKPYITATIPKKILPGFLRVQELVR